MVKPALTLALPGGVAMSFQRIPSAGDPEPHRMGERGLGVGYRGSSDPVTWVQLTRPFYLGTFPVTQAQFEAWTAAEKIEHENDFKEHPDHPAENMDWWQANAFCAWLTRVVKEEIPTGWMACLPTEAEWEYACRAGTETEYYTGDGEVALGEAGWYDGNSEESTHPVGAKAPNEFGLYDMHGNVWEWCHDVYAEHSYCSLVDGVCDPGAATREADYVANRCFKQSHESQIRVLRGGSWYCGARDCRSGVRIRFRPGYRDGNLGFRVCLVPGPLAQAGLADTSPGSAQGPGDGGRGTRPESDGPGTSSGGVPDLATARLPRAAVDFFDPVASAYHASNENGRNRSCRLNQLARSHAGSGAVRPAGIRASSGSNHAGAPPQKEFDAVGGRIHRFNHR